MQTGRHDVFVFASKSEDNDLVIFIDSVASRLKLKCRDAVIAKTQYLQMFLVKFITMLLHGLFVTWGNMIYHLSVKDGIVKLMNQNKRYVNLLNSTASCRLPRYCMPQ